MKNARNFWLLFDIFECVLFLIFSYLLMRCLKKESGHKHKFMAINKCPSLARSLHCARSCTFFSGTRYGTFVTAVLSFVWLKISLGIHKSFKNLYIMLSFPCLYYVVITAFFAFANHYSRKGSLLLANRALETAKTKISIIMSDTEV